LFYYKQKGDDNYCHRLFLPWFYCSEEGDDSKLVSPFSVVVSQRKRRRQQLSSPFSMVLLQKMATITIVTFFSGFVTKKVMATMLLPSSMVMVL